MALPFGYAVCGTEIAYGAASRGFLYLISGCMVLQRGGPVDLAAGTTPIRRDAVPYALSVP
eukprot:2347167-Rhodomonas_salina.2